MKRMALTIAAIAMAGSLFARELTGDEQAELSAVADRFVAALEAGDYDTVLDVMPPKILDQIAQQAGISTTETRNMVIALMSQMNEMMVMSEFHYDLNAFDIAEAGALKYGYYPSDFVVEMDGVKSKVSNETLALFDEKWYLLRVDEQQLPLIKAAYPELSDIKVPQTQVEPVE